MEKEIWRAIKGYEGLYEVSNLGRVKSLHYWHSDNEKVIKQHAARGGYRAVNLTKDKKQRGFYVHRLVADAFLEKPIGAWVVNHKDGDKTNNASSNLEWCTFQQNILHAAYELKKMEAFPVICVETGIIYPSVNLAARATGGNHSDITQACLDGHAYRGTHWVKISKNDYYGVKSKYV